MFKKIKPLDLIYICFPPLFHTLIYFLSKLIERTPYNITTNIDNKIPFIAWFIIFYCIWYSFLLIAPLIIYIYDKNHLRRYAITYVVCSIVSCIIYIAWPTTFSRPELSNSNFVNYIVNWIYSNDIPAVNCFPSFHALLCFLWILTISLNKNINKVLRLIISFFCIGIVLSTMFVKQHSYIDVIGAFIIVVINYLIVCYFDKKYLKKI